MRKLASLSLIFLIFLSKSQAQFSTKREKNRDSTHISTKWIATSIVHFQFGEPTPLEQDREGLDIAVNVDLSFKFSKNWSFGLGTGLSNLVNVNIPVEISSTFSSRGKRAFWLKPSWGYLFPINYDHSDNRWERIEYKGGHYWNLSLGLKKTILRENAFLIGLSYRYSEIIAHTIYRNSELVNKYMLHRYSLFIGFAF